MKTAFVFLAEGFEEIEALTVIDVLRRAEIPVKTVSITSALQVKGAHGVIVNADVLYDNTLFADASWLILPGGMPGATNLYDFAPLLGLLEAQAATPNGRIAAICAAPAVVLGQSGLLKGEKATCYPGFESMCEGAETIDCPVVVSGKYVLGNRPANALLWALEIVKADRGGEVANHVATGMLLHAAELNEGEPYFG